MNTSKDYSSETSQDSNENINNIESIVEQEQMIDDLMDLLKGTIENTSILFKDLMDNIETSIKDDAVKNETHKIVSDMNQQFLGVLNETRSKVQNNIKQSADVFNPKEEE